MQAVATHVKKVCGFFLARLWLFPPGSPVSSLYSREKKKITWNTFSSYAARVYSERQLALAARWARLLRCEGPWSSVQNPCGDNAPLVVITPLVRLDLWGLPRNNLIWQRKRWMNLKHGKQKNNFLTSAFELPCRTLSTQPVRGHCLHIQYNL